MKPAAFDYCAPTELDEVVSLLAQYGDDAKLLAGGQSLMPLMNMRLVKPQVVLDLNRIGALEQLSPTPEGGLVVGALTRQRTVECSREVAQQQPLLADTMPLIGHVQIRNRGTIGGSLVHADPAAELPAVCLALEAEFVLRSATRQRIVPAADFFVMLLTTATEPDELLTEIRLPSWPQGQGWDIQEVSRRQGDFALVGAVATLQIDASDLCQEVRLTLFGVAGTPVRMLRAEARMRGQRLEETVLADVARIVTDDLDPETDLHASATYRKEVGGVMARRTLQQAWRRARQSM